MKLQVLHGLTLGKCEEVENRRFCQPQVTVLAAHEGLTFRAKELFDRVSIQSQDPYLALSEFCAKITYLSFEMKKDIHEILKQQGHYSPYNTAIPAVLITGLAVETSMELIAHGEFEVSRMTTSACRAMSNPMYCIPPDLLKKNLSSILRYLNATDELLNVLATEDAVETEQENMFMSGYKATALVMSGGLKDWHKLFIGRIKPLGKGVESHVVDVVSQINSALLDYYPDSILRQPDQYRESNNQDKYSI